MCALPMKMQLFGNSELLDQDVGVRNFRTTTADRELSEESTHKKFLLVRQEGKRQVQRE